MTRSFRFWVPTVLSLGCLVLLVAGSATGRSNTAPTFFAAAFDPVNEASSSQEVATGEWSGSLSQKKSKPGKADEAERNLDGEDAKPDRINLSFTQPNESGNGKSQMGQTYEFSDLQGLTREQVVRGGPVSFSLVREAGRLDCQGSFQDGQGSGTFRFTGNPAFVSAMKSRGFNFETQPGDNNGRHRQNRLMAATTLNVTTALADDLLSAGFGNLEVEDLFKAAIFKIDSKFMREMKASGFPNLGMEDLVKARIFKIDANFVSEVVQMGFAKESFESLVKMRIFKVTPDFLAELRSEGLGDISVEEIVKLRIFKIDGEFIRKAKAEGVPLQVERLVQRKIGVGRRAGEFDE